MAALIKRRDNCLRVGVGVIVAEEEEEEDVSTATPDEVPPLLVE
jgi:hypothetical protein